MAAESGNLPVIFLMGPTASGKTSLAVELLQRLPLEIISVDSAMVYRGMDIGTAKPGPEILARAPHRLIDICDPAEAYSAGRFRSDARKEIAEIQARGVIPLLVGGTGLYFRALEQGIAELPPANALIRARLERELREFGLKRLHERLAGVDPEAAERIHLNDPQRIQRALEVYEITGKPISQLFSISRSEPYPHRIVKIILSPDDREIIHARVKIRFLQMLELGLIDEVKGFHQRGDLTPATPAMRMVGYRQIWRYLEGEIDYKEMVEHGVVATRQLAKRQLTWLRKEQNGTWFDAGDQDLVDKIFKFLSSDPDFCARV